MAGRHYLTKSDLNALHFATHELPRPKGWNQPFTVGHYWRAALVVFFNHGVDTGTVFKSAGFHEPILWRHVSWRPEPPNGQGRDPLAFKAILSLPQPTAFNSLLRGFDGECPCCRRKFDQA